MAPKLQVTFDAADPDKLASFWAEAVRYHEQDPPSGFETWDDWLEANDLAAMKGQAAAIVDPDGVGPRFYFQKVPERKTAKNRVHLDINVTNPSLPEHERVRLLETESKRLQGLGATQIELVQRPGEIWIVMNDPEGNEFCLQ